MAKWYHRFISEDDIRRVEEAIQEAEKTTSGEIVPVLVRRSSMIGHVPLQVATFWVILLFLFQFTVGSHLQEWLELKWFWIGGLLLAPLVARLSRLSLIQRVLTPDADQDMAVVTRARLEFEANRVDQTRSRTGILIFISLMEHECVVLADEGISGTLPPETWDRLVKDLITGVKKGEAGRALCEAIRECGRLLSEKFPKPADQENQLENHLVIKE